MEKLQEDKAVFREKLQRNGEVEEDKNMKVKRNRVILLTFYNPTSISIIATP